MLGRWAVHTGVLVAVTGLLAVAIFGWPSTKTQLITMGPGIFRAQASSAPLPDYPPRSISERHAGCAVAEVLVSASGTPSTVHVLQAPDEMISGAVEKALLKWRFRQARDPATRRPSPFQSRLAFYFELAPDGPVVIDAAARRRNR